MSLRPVLGPRQDRNTPGHCGVLGAAPASCQQRWLPREKDFGARSHGIGTRCLRFAGRVAPPPRKTRFRLLAKLCRAGFVNPQGSNERFPSFESLPPFSSLPDASYDRPMKAIMAEVDCYGLRRLLPADGDPKDVLDRCAKARTSQADYVYLGRCPTRRMPRTSGRTSPPVATATPADCS